MIPRSPLPLILALSLMLGACSLIPPHLLPDLAVPAEYKEATSADLSGLPWKVAAAGASAPVAPWQIFGLPDLPDWLARVDQANASLAVAKARHAQAAALIDQARAAQLPNLTGNAGVQRARSNGSGALSNTQTLSVASNWEIDLWGRLRAALGANTAAAEASAADLAGVRLSLQAQLVQALLSLRVVNVQRQLLEATVADYERYVQLTADRVRFGVAGRVELAQAESQLRSAQAQAIETGVQRSQLEHALAVLVGELPSQFKLPAELAGGRDWRAPLLAQAESRPSAEKTALGEIHQSVLPLAPVLPEIPLSAPSTLLERRPDIAAAERRAAAANAQVGVARAAFFPVLSLTASGGQRSTVWGEILAAPARFWSIGPALATPLFDAGLRRSQEAQAVAAWEQATATYRQTVLTAFQEVEDQLATLRILADEAQVQAEAVNAARLSAELTLAQYRNGTAASLQVIIANGALLTAERSALDLHGRRLQAAVSLLRALGGGWQGEGEALARH